ncbi:MAG: CPBP family intramembrane metalloprotease [Clostridia bacterium]|nr:CPBP family intramembrane metalloprotease [Clostridia bacterium]
MSEPVFFFLMLAISCGIQILVFFSWVKFIERRKVETLGFFKEGVIYRYIRGFITGIIMLAAALAVLALLGMVKIEAVNISSERGTGIMSAVMVVLIGWMIQGASEEIMIRGWLLPVISVRHNLVLGIIISSSIFGFLHLFNNNISFLAILNLILFGVFAAFYALWEGGLWGICALHTSWNWAQGNLFGLEVSGSLYGGGSILDLETFGPGVITGGNFGVEGGLIETASLLTGIFILYVLMRRKS